MADIIKEDLEFLDEVFIKLKRKKLLIKYLKDKIRININIDLCLGSIPVKNYIIFLKLKELIFVKNNFLESLYRNNRFEYIDCKNKIFEDITKESFIDCIYLNYIQYLVKKHNFKVIKEKLKDEKKKFLFRNMSQVYFKELLKIIIKIEEDIKLTDFEYKNEYLGIDICTGPKPLRLERYRNYKNHYFFLIQFLKAHRKITIKKNQYNFPNIYRILVDYCNESFTSKTQNFNFKGKDYFVLYYDSTKNCICIDFNGQKVSFEELLNFIKKKEDYDKVSFEELLNFTKKKEDYDKFLSEIKKLIVFIYLYKFDYFNELILTCKVFESEQAIRKFISYSNLFYIKIQDKVYDFLFLDCHNDDNNYIELPEIKLSKLLELISYKDLDCSYSNKEEFGSLFLKCKNNYEKIIRGYLIVNSFPHIKDIGTIFSLLSKYYTYNDALKCKKI